MATKLKGLKVKKVDFVDEGANPDAHITLFKSRDGVSGKTSGSEPKESIWKRLFGPLAKLAGVAPEELDNAVEAIEKSGMFFHEVWFLFWARRSSLRSLLRQYCSKNGTHFSLRKSEQ